LAAVDAPRDRTCPMSHSNKIGDDRGAKGRAAASQIRRKQANARAAELAPIIARLRASGVTSLYGIAKALTALALLIHPK
jgi:hypothetical protein